MVVGNLFPIGKVTFQGRTVSFREANFVRCIFEELLSNFRRWHEFFESELDVDGCQGMSSGRHESMLCRFHHDSIQKFSGQMKVYSL